MHYPCPHPCHRTMFGPENKATPPPPQQKTQLAREFFAPVLPLLLPCIFFYLLFCCFLRFLCFHPSAPERRHIDSSAPAVPKSAAGLSQTNILVEFFSPLCFTVIWFIQHQSPPSPNFTHCLSSSDYSISNILVFCLLFHILSFQSFTFLSWMVSGTPPPSNFLLLFLLCYVYFLFTTVTSIRLIGSVTLLVCVI